MKNLIFLIFLIFSFSVFADDASEIQKKNRAFMKECYTDRGITNVDDFKKYIKKYDNLWNMVYKDDELSTAEIKKRNKFIKLYGDDPCIMEYKYIDVEFSYENNIANRRMFDIRRGKKDWREWCKAFLDDYKLWLIEQNNKLKAIEGL